MKLFTIGFTKKSAAQFFKLIRDNQIKLLVDIRLNNTSPLAGFSKGEDLEFFLKELCDCQYEHCIEYAPTKDTLDRYKKKEISWEKYVSEYQPLMLSRLAPQKFLKNLSHCIMNKQGRKEKTAFAVFLSVDPAFVRWVVTEFDQAFNISFSDISCFSSYFS